MLCIFYHSYKYKTAHINILLSNLFSCNESIKNSLFLLSFSLFFQNYHLYSIYIIKHIYNSTYRIWKSLDQIKSDMRCLLNDIICWLSDLTGRQNSIVQLRYRATPERPVLLYTRILFCICYFRINNLGNNTHTS